MKALQLHYTSCRAGRSSAAGFQTRTLSDGIEGEEQRELEQRGVYRPPRDVSSEPTPEQITASFPRALRNHRLASGRLGLSLSCYAGRDYSGRWGNYFVHGLVFTENPPSRCWPIDLFTWAGWVTHLPSEQDTAEAPPALPATELAPGLDGSFGAEDLAEFLREAPERTDTLVRLARALVLSLASARPLVVRDEPTKALYWLASLQKLLPPALAWNISWSTYQDDPRGCAQVNGTCGETDFHFSEAEARFRFFLFDLEGDLASEVPALDDDYPALATACLLRDPARLNRFFSFCDRFRLERPGPELLAAWHLFEIANDPAWTGINGARLEAMLDLIASRALPWARAELLLALARAADASGESWPAADLCRLFEALAALGSAATTDTRGAARLRLLQLLEGPLLRLGDGLEKVEPAWHRLSGDGPSERAELARVLLGARLWNGHAPRLADCSETVLLLLWRLAWQALGWNGSRQPWRERPITALLPALITGANDPARLLTELLAPLPADAETIAELSIAAAGTRGAATDLPLALGRGLRRGLAKRPPAFAASVRARLEAAGSDALLVGEAREWIETAEDPTHAFEEVRRVVLDVLPGFGERALDALAGAVLEALPPARRGALAIEWIERGDEARFGVALAGRCLEVANAALPLDPRRDSARQAAAVAAAAQRRKHTLQPDRPALRGLIQLGRAKTPPTTSDLNRLRGSLEAMTKGDYSFLLDELLVPLLEQNESRRDHDEVLRATFRTADQEAFIERYRAYLLARRKPPWEPAMVAALHSWLAFDRRASASDPRLAALEAEARDALIAALARLQEEERSELERQLARRRLDAHAEQQWRTWRDRADRRRNTWWRRALRWLAPTRWLAVRKDPKPKGRSR